MVNLNIGEGHANTALKKEPTLFYTGKKGKYLLRSENIYPYAICAIS